MKRMSNALAALLVSVITIPAFALAAIFTVRAGAEDIASMLHFDVFEKRASADPVESPPAALSFFAQLALLKQTFENGQLEAATSTNLVPNPGFEVTGGAQTPAYWKKGVWGEHAAVFLFPVTGHSGENGAGITIKDHKSGDAKWRFDPVTSPTPGIYAYTDYYAADSESFITLSIELDNGSSINKELASLPPSSSFTPAFTHFSVPPNTRSFVVYHLIRNNGTLAIDDVSVELLASVPSVFSEGAVSLVFDDGWDSQYDHAAPKLREANFKGTFFIATDRLDNRGFDEIVSRRQVKKLAAMGHEIAAHTLTHPHLSALERDTERKEIEGSKKDLEQMGIAPIVSFAYPFGDYDRDTLALVQNAGFFGARSTTPGAATVASDKYQLPHFSVENTSTLEEMKRAVDEAIAKKEWLIFSFHQIDRSNAKYSITPKNFDALIDYLAASGMNVVTFADGLRSVQ